MQPVIIFIVAADITSWDEKQANSRENAHSSSMTWMVGLSINI